MLSFTKMKKTIVEFASHSYRDPSFYPFRTTYEMKVDNNDDITKRTKTVAAFNLHGGAPMFFTKEG